MTQVNDKTYDLLLKRFVGDQLCSVTFLRTDMELEQVASGGALIAEAMFMKDGSLLNGLPTWLTYFPTDADEQLIIVEHGVSPWSLQGPVKEFDEARQVRERGDLLFEKKFQRLLWKIVLDSKKLGGGSRSLLGEIRELLGEYDQYKSYHRTAVRWNIPGYPSKATAESLKSDNPDLLAEVLTNKQPVLSRYCKDHPRVETVSYDTVSIVLGTSGCSVEEPYWNWSVMGVIQTKRGVLTVCPGDWIVESIEGVVEVLSHEQYLKLYGAK